MKRKVWKIVLIAITGFIILFSLPFPEITALKIAIDGTYAGEVGGFGGATASWQYRRYQCLESFASTQKLVKLYKNHPSPAVKCYSFKALVQRNKANLIELLAAGIVDERIIECHWGCMSYHNKVGDVLYEESYDYLSLKEINHINSVLLYSDVELEYKKKNLAWKTYDSTHYKRIWSGPLLIGHNYKKVVKLIKRIKYFNFSEFIAKMVHFPGLPKGDFGVEWLG